MLINIFNLHLLVLTFMGFAIWEPIKQELSGEASADQLMCIPWCEIVHPEHFWALARQTVFNAQVNSHSANLLNPIVFWGRHNSKLLGFVTSQKLTFKKTDLDIHDA